MPSQLTTLSDVKAFLAIGTQVGSGDDPLLTRLITAVSAFIETYCNRTFAQGNYTETRNGNGRQSMSFKNTPCSAISSVTVDGVSIPARPAFGSGGIFVETFQGGGIGSGYTFDTDVLYLDGYAFSKGKQNVTLAYTAGYASIPYDLAQAAITLVGLTYKSRDRLGVTGKGIGPEHISYLVGKLPVDVQMTIDQYSRVVLPW